MRQEGTALAREAMLKSQGKPAYEYEDRLVTCCEVTRPMEYDTDSDKKRSYDWQIVVLSNPDSYIRSLWGQTLPRGYLESLLVSFNDENLLVAWKRLEARCGHSNAQGMVALIAVFDEALAMDFASLGELIVRRQGLVLNSIFVKGKKVDGLAKSVSGVAHLKGEKKAKKKAKAKREEIPADVALLSPISNFNIVAANATQASGSSTLTAEQVKQDADELMTSPTVSPTPPSSSSSDMATMGTTSRNLFREVSQRILQR
ncbi:hypothetical protein PC128_g22272 [Phytophthora cactorum]|nr:hypothetical protein PC128_g22272 [Phytophthora cactorum]